MSAFFSRKDVMMSLRDAVKSGKAGESLEDIPDRLARVMSLFYSGSIHPAFRQDVFNVLDSSINLALAMVDATFPVTHATLAISRQQAILARILAFIQEDRASEHGFSIQTSDGRLIGYFSTEAAAYEQAAIYAALSVQCQVVPALLNSLTVVRPRKVEAITEEDLSQPIPLTPEATISSEPEEKPV